MCNVLPRLTETMRLPVSLYSGIAATVGLLPAVCIMFPVNPRLDCATEESATA